MPKLTKRVVEAAQPSGRDYFIWCDELPGFGLRVFVSGKRSYLVQYRAGGRSRRVTIGPHGPVTPEQARKQALALLGEIARGGNPAEDRANQRDAITVKDLCADYLSAMERGLVMGKGGRPKKESTLYVDRGRIERHIIPLLGRRLVKDLTRSDTERFIRDVTAGKTAGTVKTGKLRGKAVVEGGAGTAARTAGLLGGILTFAISEGLIASNPATGVKRPADKRRQRRLTPQEYGKLGHALQCAAKEGETPQAITGAWLLTLTGCRLGEIENLRWDEVDTASRCFRMEDTKEGFSVRPIGDSVFELLQRVDRSANCPYVLPAVRGNGRYGGLPGAWERLAKRAGLSDVTPHIMRHSFASVAADLGFSDPTIGALIGHSSGTVTSRYMHHLDSVLIAAADRVSERIVELLKGRTAGNA